MRASTHREYGNKGYVEDQREFFDKLITQDWDDYLNLEWDKARQSEVKGILSRIPLPKRVLDLGCGCGYHDMIFAEAKGVERVVGIDYSEKSVETAEKQYPHTKVQRYVANFYEGRNVVQEKGPFDLVASFQVIEHLSNPDEFMEVSALFARKGGHVAIVTPNGKRLQNLWLRITGKPVEMIDPLHFREYGVGELTELGHKGGLKVVSYFGRNIHLSGKGREIIKVNGRLASWLAPRLPKFCDVIGVIFQK